MLEADAKAAMPMNMLVGQLRHNHTLHEAAHAVAHEVLHGLETELLAVSPSWAHAEVVRSILGESFANALELAGTEHIHTALLDDIFYSLNSYMAPGEKGGEMLRLAAETWGTERRFAVLLAAYFESNATAAEPGPEVWERVAEAAGFTDAGSELPARLVKAAFTLNKSFRDQTTPYYFERRGLAKEAGEVFESPWLADRDHRTFIGLFLEKVWPLIVSGQSTPQHRATTP
jgi:hypothetical protein